MRHTRGLALILVLAVLLASACQLSSVPWVSSVNGQTYHWKRTTTAQVVVPVVIDPSAEALRPLIESSVADVSARSKRVDMRIVDRSGSPYLKVVGQSMNGGKASISINSQGHIVGGVVYMDNTLPIDSQRQNMVCHELTGHALGLAHGNTEGPCQGGKLTAWDVAVIDAIHDHVDAA